MPLPKRTAAAPAAAAPPPAQATTARAVGGGSVNFGDPDFYFEGGSLTTPEGDYIWTKLRWVMFTPQNKQGVATKQAFLAVALDLLDLNNPTEEGKHVQVYSAGQKAHLSFLPNADGTGLDTVPNAPSQGAPGMTNWAILLGSLYDSGMPRGVLTNSLLVLEGLKCHMHQIDEPEGRKSLGAGAAVSEAAMAANLSGQPQQQNRRSNKIAVVQEIKPDGRSWEWGGGVRNLPAGVVAAPKPNGVPAPAPAQVAQPVAVGTDRVVDADVAEAAVNVCYAIILKRPTGMPRAALRNEMIEAINKDPNLGPDAVPVIIDPYFDTDAHLNELLQTVGPYHLVGAMVKPIA